MNQPQSPMKGYTKNTIQNLRGNGGSDSNPLRVLWRRNRGSILTVLLALCVIMLCTINFARHEHLVLNRDKDNPQHAFLVYIPGYNVTVSAYSPLLSLVQNEFDKQKVNLHTVIVQYPKLWEKEYPPFIGCNSLVQEALQQARKTEVYDNIGNDAVFIGGHSLGSILAQMVAYKHPSLFKGLIVHSGYIMTKYRLENRTLPVPTITLSGTRDGMNRWSYVAMQHKDLRETYPSNQLYRTNAPAILIEGMNHYQVASNVPPYVENRDLKESISTKAALKDLAKLTAAFMLQQVQSEKNKPKVIRKMLERSERRYFQPYIDAIESDESGETCVLAQKLHLEHDGIYIVPHYPATKLNFIFSKPKSDHDKIQIDWRASRAFTWFGRSSVPHAVQTLRCKMVSKEQVFDQVSIEYDSCASINEIIFHRALDSLPSDIRRAYKTNARRLEFGKDRECSSGVEWLCKDLEFTPKDGAIVVHSPKLKSGAGDGRYSGKFYCTLLPMSRALEYILVDSLPKAA